MAFTIRSAEVSIELGKTYSHQTTVIAIFSSESWPSWINYSLPQKTHPCYCACHFKRSIANILNRFRYDAVAVALRNELLRIAITNQFITIDRRYLNEFFNSFSQYKNI